MPYVSGRAGAATLLIVVAAIFGAGFTCNWFEKRDRLQAHVASTVGGDPRRGEAMFIQYGCGSCHLLKHVRKATGKVGPQLDGIADQAIVAGKLANSPENVERWIREPQAVSPGTAMPELNVGQRDARDITAFLYTR